MWVRRADVRLKDSLQWAHLSTNSSSVLFNESAMNRINKMKRSPIIHIGNFAVSKIITVILQMSYKRILTEIKVKTKEI